ncbi:MAG: molecular chaperone [Bacteroidia bacterium]|nr:molecular chaperone [Bacteroidia bacterium]
MKKSNLFSGLILAGMLLLLIPAENAFAQGNLLITPRRALFEGKTRSLDLNLANIGKDTAIYSISLIQERMKEDGSFESITEPDPGQRFADRYIRFFPRTVTLGPNESQSVKVQLIRSGELEPGEYRSHFYFRATPVNLPLGEDQKVNDTTTLTVKLTPVFGLTIPVIIRVGDSDAKVTITGLSLDFNAGTDPVLKMAFNRTGNMSVYGNIVVDHISPQGVITHVGMANGVSVYTPNTIRRFQLALNKVSGIDLKSGKIRVTYSAPSDVKPEKYAEAELPLK